MVALGYYPLSVEEDAAVWTALESAAAKAEVATVRSDLKGWRPYPDGILVSGWLQENKRGEFYLHLVDGAVKYFLVMDANRGDLTTTKELAMESALRGQVLSVQSVVSG